VILAVVAALAAAELALDLSRPPQAVVRVENLGGGPINDLVVACGASRVRVPRVEAGGFADVAVAGRGPGTLQLTYDQPGSPLGSFALPGFDPAQMARDGLRQVLRIRPSEVERYCDEADPATPLGRFARDRWRGLRRSVEE